MLLFPLIIVLEVSGSSVVNTNSEFNLNSVVLLLWIGLFFIGLANTSRLCQLRDQHQASDMHLLSSEMKQ